MLIKPFIEIQSTQFEVILNEFKGIIPDSILSCMLFGLVERLDFLKIIEGEQ
ncbi:hypothetical protein M2105_005262 [Paenibacillus sp. PastF-1]|nr:hypothetical protein [Paenibacillus sp. PastF-2]MDF9857381.1 hypothetical protein [Paenibacillus sp. PastF-1]MDH6482649.1 hypothetical protein [Paenibacillus sp. PastH-2]